MEQKQNSELLTSQVFWTQEIVKPSLPGEKETVLIFEPKTVSSVITKGLDLTFLDKNALYM